MASTRLRRAFSYPDSDSDGEKTARLELDDQEQESLIQALRVENEQHNARYELGLTALQIACAFAYVPPLVSPSATVFGRFLAVLSIVSLMSTWHSTRQNSLRRLGNKGKGSVQESGVGSTLKENQRAVNVLLCAVLAAVSCVRRNKSDQGDAFPYFLLLVPGVVLSVTWLAERTMVSVDIESLESLKYDYKGA